MTEELSRYRSFFDQIYDVYNSQTYLHSDPIEYYYTSPSHKEYCAFTASAFAYGRVNSIKQFLHQYFAVVGFDPLNTVAATKLYYRFQTAHDILCYRQFMHFVYQKYHSLEAYMNDLSNDLETAVGRFIESAHDFGKRNDAGKGYFFLFPDPFRSSAKRMRMFLRWMVRKDAIDPGIWQSYQSSEIFYPMDTHLLKFALHRGIIRSMTNSYKNTVTVTNYFKNINSEDPVKYDFSIARLGIILGCQYHKNKICYHCPHLTICPL